MRQKFTLFKIVSLWFIISASIFAQQSVTVTSPNGGERWQIGSSKVITWTSVNVSQVGIQLSTDGGNNWQTIIGSVNASLGKYTWDINTVNYDPSQQSLIRVYDIAGPTTADTSNAVFTLSEIKIDAPLASTRWQVATVQDIKWVTSSEISNVIIEYTTDGVVWNLISNNVNANLGSYTWTVPNSPTSNAKIRISDKADPNNYYSESSEFTIAYLELTSPLGGEDWFAGEYHSITWNSTNVTNVKLEYSTDNGTSWQTITNSTPAGDGNYTWGVPADPSNQALVRVSDASSSTVNSTSPNKFIISSIVVTAPNGFEGWEIGSSQKITWTSNLSGNIKIELSTDGGFNFPTEIVSGIAATTGSYDYTVPNIPTNKARIRITNLTNPDQFDIGDDNFTMGTLSLTSPAGGELWQASNGYSIQWNATSGIDFVKLEYSTDGTNYNSIINSTDASTGSYYWTLPSSVSSSTGYVRIRDAVTGLGISDVSNVLTFSRLSISAPTSSTAWQAGKSQSIKWSATNISNLNIEYSTDNGTNWNSIVSGQDASVGSYDWTIPAGISTTQGRIRFIDADATSNSLNSSAFKIGNVAVATPGGGVKVRGGGSYNITWTSTSSISRVRLMYSSNGGTTFSTISGASALTASDGSYSWSVPNSATDQARIRISDTFGSTINDTSDLFSIATVQVTAPVNQGFQAGSTTNITWSVSSNISNVNLEYTLDGTTWNTIASNISAALGTYAWTIPTGISSSDAQIRISDVTDSGIYGIGSKFWIGTVNLDQPKSTDVLTGGSTYDIKWTASSSISNVKLEYSTDNGGTYSTISGASSVSASTGSYTWSVPNVYSNNAKIRISDASASSIVEESESFIISTLRVTFPGSGEAVKTGSDLDITWTNSANVTKVNLAYSLDKVNYTTIATEINAALGTYKWTVPDGISSANATIRIIDFNNSAVYSTSNEFKIGFVSVDLPDGTVKLFGGGAFNINWTASSSISNIRLEYSSDGGTNFSNIPGASSLDASTGSYSWTVPNTATTNGKIRISDANGDNINDSSNTFTVFTLNLSVPNGSEGLMPDVATNITWTSQNITNIKIEYSSDNGTSWNILSSSTAAAAGTYSWTPSNTTSQALIRLSDVDNASYSDQSDAVFKIGDVEILSPNGGEVHQANRTQTINWTNSSNVSLINIDLSTDNGSTWLNVASNVDASLGTYTFTMNNVSSTQALMRVVDVENSNINDASNAIFTIEKLELLTPNGGTTYLAGSSTDITWSSSGVANVKIEYSTNSGTSWSVIDTKAATPASYTWTVPNTPTNKMLVRVLDSDITPSTISDQSDATSEIKAIIITAPNGGESFDVLSTQTITWDAHPGIATVRIEYNVDGGSWKLIKSGVTASDKSYNWTIPNDVSTNVRIRIFDEANTNSVDTNDAAFSIGSLSLSSPNGGEKYLVGSTHDITWSTISSISNVKLEYQVDGGAWTTIVASTPAAAESYSWTIPDAPSSSAMVRISNVDDPTVFQNSANLFTIAKMEVTAPNGGEIVQVGDKVEIKWNSANVTNVQIDYSLDNGGSWNTLSNSYAASLGSYEWTVNTASAIALVRVTDTGDNSITDQSNASFKIIQLELTSPNGNESWKVGDTYQITWNSNGVNNVAIEYSSNGGTSWNTVTSSTAAGNKSYDWVIPNISSETAMVRLTDKDNATVSDSSSNYFLIGDISVTAPATGSFLQAGTLNNITWSASSSLQNVKIEYRENETAAWQSIQTSYNASLGTYEWRVPGTLSTTEARVKVTHAKNGSTIADSTGLFTVNALQLTFPNSGDVIESGSSTNITWSSTNITNLIIEYSTDFKNPSWTVIDGNYPAGSGSYTWNVPPNITADSAIFRLTDKANSSIQAESDGPVKIGWVGISSPTSASIWQSGHQYSINWNNSSSVKNVKIEYTTDNGTSWNSVISSIAASKGTYAWTIPDNLSSASGKIRISDADASAQISRESDSFTFVYLSITQPNGNQNWQEGAKKQITWNASNLITNLALSYSVDNGANWVSIVANTPANSGSYDWTLPSPLTSTQALIRAIDVNATHVRDSSDAVFIISSLDLTAPSGGEQLQANTSKTITWSAANLSNVKLEYTTDNGSNWNTIVSAIGASVGTYDWTIPAVSSTQARVRISSTSDATIVDSSSIFTISNLALTSPNGGEEWQAGSKRQITWTSSAINNLILYYSTNNGGNWIQIASGISAASGSYDWTIPSNISTAQGLVRILDADNSAIRDSSDAVFTVGSLTLTGPTGGEQILAGATQAITWTAENISNVKLEYSSNNGTSWNTIASSVAAAVGTYNWSVPSSSTNQALVRVLSVADATVKSESAIFTISALSLSSPNGSEIWHSGATKNITWSAGQVSNIKIEYSLNNGTSWQQIAASVNAALGSYSWTIPDSITSTQALIRITDTGNSNVKDESDANFTLSKLMITSPNGAETWQANRTQNITWSSANSGNVKLEYSSDNGTSWNTIVASISSDLGIYAWDIPDFSANQVLVKISSTAESSLTDQSDALFTVAKLEVTSPNGGENWQAGSTKTITWASGQVNNVDLYYSTNNGSSWSSIVSGQSAATGSYSWTVPAVSTSNVLVRAIDASNSAVRDSSDAVFVIGSLAITSPAGGEQWQGGTTKTISWTSSKVQNVKLEYSVDNGGSWNTIISSVSAATGSYNWTVANSASNQVKIRASSVDDTTMTAESPLLKISTLSLTSPNGGEIWQAGSSQNITWSSGQIANLALYYSTNEGGTWNQITNSTDASTGSFAWTVPSSATTKALIRASDATNSAIKDSSDNLFTIAAISLTSPAGGEVWQSGTTRKIKWSSSNVGGLKLEYSDDNGSSWNTIIASVASTLGEYDWAIPDFSSNTTIVRISAVNDASFKDESAIFTVKKLQLTAPDGGEVLQAGTSTTISWTSGQIANLNLFYSTNGGSIWNSIISNYSTANTSYDWSIPANVTSSNAIVRIVDASESSIKDSSASSFTIAALSLTSPSGGEQWQAGDVQQIKWSSTNLSTVKLEYTTNNGTSWNEIINSLNASTGTYDWTIPSVSSAQTKVRISSTSTTSVNDESGIFTISSLQLTSPNGGEQWQAGSSKSITWTSSEVTNVNLQYSLNNGGSWSTIASNVNASLGTYTWAVPDTFSSSVLVKVTDASNSSLADSSDNVFTLASLKLTSPNGGEVVQGGTNTNITWTAENLSSIKLEYTTNNGSNWTEIITSLTASTGSYSWAIPESATSTAKIRISSTLDATLKDESDALFTISTLTLTSPNGGENWQAGSTQSLTWSSGKVSNVDLAYSTDKGKNWSNIISNISASLGTYSWTIPSNVSTTNAVVRVSVNGNSAIQDTSDNIFTVSSLVITEPAAGAKFRAGTTRDIKWSSTNLTNLKIEYSTDNGTSWNTVVSSVSSSDGIYSWAIPSSVGTSQARIKISALSDATIFDQSDLFTITQLAVTSPNGGEVYQAGSTHSISWTSANITNLDLFYSTDNGSNWTSIIAGVQATTGTYSWTIPSNVSSTQTLIKLVDANDNTVQDVSNNPFTVGSITVTSPTAASKWQSGSSHAVTWTSTNVNNIKIEYSTNNGSAWSSIASSVDASLGTFTWTLPDSIPTNLAQIRLSNVDDNTFKDESDVFTVSFLKITSPNGNERWQLSSQQQITWNSDQTNLLNLFYSLDKGANWNSIATNVQASNGTYTWNIPGTLSASSDALIKAVDAAENTIMDSSDAVFTIGSLLLTSPTGSEKVQSGRDLTIQWTGNKTLNSIQIDYSVDGGTNWTTLQSGVSSSLGKYTWSIPENVTSDKARIRIQDVQKANLSSESNDFTIAGLKLTSPSGSEFIQGGKSRKVKWSSSYVTSIKLEVSTDNGSNWSVLGNASQPAANSEYSWNIASTMSSKNALLRISDVDAPTIIDTIDNPFTIGNVTITQPNGGEVLQAGSTYSIKFTNTASVENVKIEYSADGGTSYSSIVNSTTADSVYEWTIPSDASTSNGLIRISNALSDSISDVSDGNFSINSLLLTSPAGGESFKVGSSQSITWTASSSIPNVKLEYFTSGLGWQLIANGIAANTGTYAWTVPSAPSDSVLVRVSDVTNANVNDVNDSKIRISNVTIAAPVGGEKWQVNKKRNIEWTNTANVNAVDLHYSTDNKASWKLIKTGVTASSGKYEWTLPNITSSTVFVKVSDTESSGDVSDVNSAAFTISKLNITQPATPENWVAGDTKSIKWNNSSDISTVVLEYSVNSGNTWLSISDSVKASDGAYSWVIPNTLPAGSMLIKIYDKTTPELVDTSSVITIISPTLALTSPIGGEFVQAGKTYSITWNSSSDISNLKIEYTSNGGTNWTVIQNSFPADSSKYTWNVPASLSTNSAKIRLSDAVNTFVIDSSAAVFTIGWVQLSSPNGGEHWQAGASENIQWTASASVSNVKIEYSTDNGSNWTLLDGSVAANAGTYNWNISNLASTTGLVRISDASSSLAIQDVSETNFTISLIQLVLPNGNEQIQAGTNYAVKWTNSGDITGVDLLYSTNNGSAWQNIASNVSADSGQYTWSVPSNISSNNALFKVRDFSFPQVSDVSDTTFDIKRLEITSPVGGENWQVATNQNISWNFGNLTKIKIEYSTNNGTNWITVADSVTASTNSYNWAVPNTITSEAVVKISDLGNSSITSTSSKFAIFNPSVQITAPDGGEHWQAGSTHKIEWTSSLVSSVKISYSLDNGANWNLLSSSFPADSFYTWVLPDNIESDKALVKISDVANPHINDSSATIFSISRLEVTSPATGEYWNASKTRTIKWYTSSGITGVRLQYSTNNGTDWFTISGANNVNAALGKFDWDIPDFLSSKNATIRIVDAADATLSAIMDGNFTLGWITLVNPNGGENLQTGKTTTLTWTNSDVVSSVRVDLIDGKNGTIVQTYNDSTTASGGDLNITIPTAFVTDSAIVRISDLASNLNIVDSTDKYFTVSNLEVVAPTYGETWQAAKSHTIQWNSSSDIAAVNLDFSSDNGSTWDVISSNVNASLETFDWTPPKDIFSSKCLIRVSNSANSKITNNSGQFSIYKPFISILYPDGGQRTNAGLPDTIRWASSFVSVAQIELSTDDGVTWADTLVKTVPASDSQWVWNIPSNLYTNSAKIRISDITDSSVTDQSSTSFAIGWIDVTSPDGGENWQAGTSHQITWNNSANINVVNIYYATVDNPTDSNWVLLGSNISASSGSYNWGINANLASTTTRVKVVESAQGSKIQSQSSSAFTISSLALTSPNGGEFWAGGKSEDITWKASSNINTLNIDMSKDNGANWTRIFSSVAASLGKISWSIPASLFSDSMKVRLVDANDATITDESDAVFAIGSINITVFTSPEKILEGEVKKIQWEFTSNISKVDIHYRLSDKVWKQIVLNYPADSSYYNWTVPYSPSDSCYIRVRNSANFAFQDSNDAAFTIARLNLLTPNGGEVWKTGNANKVKWESSFITNLEVHYTTDTSANPTNWSAITPSAYPADSASYDWTLTDELSKASPYYRVRIRDIDFPNVYKISEKFFKMSYIKVLQPNGSHGQQIGTTYDIKWLTSTKTVSRVNLYVQTALSDENWEPIDRFVEADSGHYTWNIESNATKSARIKIEDADNPSTVFDVSDSTFTISQITLLYPKGGQYQKLQVGKSYDITWSSDYITGVHIEYSIDDGKTWNVLKNYWPADSGKYNWTVDNIPTTQARIKVNDFDFSNVLDQSTESFTIAKVELLEPNTRTAFRVNQSATIKWSTANIDTVRIQISTDGGKTWPILEAIVAASSGQYDWTVPNFVTSAARLRITDLNDLSINDPSDTTFVIGDYPSVSAIYNVQSDTVLLLYDFKTPDEELSITGFDFQIDSTGPKFSGLQKLIGDYNNIVGPATDTIKWATKSITNLESFEGPVNLSVSFKSNYNVTYPVEVKNVGIDNKAPVFDQSSISISQDAFIYGWNSALVKYSSAKDTSKPVKYRLVFSEDNIFNETPISTFTDSMTFGGLKTSTTFNVKISVEDALGNSSDYSTTYKTRAAGDFVGAASENTINSADMYAFVKAWSVPDSNRGADFYPYADSIPRITVQGDNRLEMEDLLVFVEMWDYNKVSGLPKLSPVITDNDIERRSLDIKQGESDFDIPILLNPNDRIVALTAEIKYNTSVFTFDSLDFVSDMPTGTEFSLVYNDTVNGLITFDFTDFSGSLDGSYSIKSKLRAMFNSDSQTDSISLSLTGYNSSLKKKFTKSINYVIEQIPVSYTLYQNYPNPFNPVTLIEYDVPEKAHVELVIYDILGQQVAKLVDAQQKGGHYQVRFNTRVINGGLASGVYLYRLHTKNYTVTKKMILLK